MRFYPEGKNFGRLASGRQVSMKVLWWLAFAIMIRADFNLFLLNLGTWSAIAVCMVFLDCDC